MLYLKMEASVKNASVFLLCVLIQIGIVNSQLDDLSDFANSLGSLLSGFEGGIGSDCSFTCPNGQTPRPKKHHKPSFNGCGSYGIELNMEYMADGMTSCCNTHDICYDTCNKKKDDCDKVFRECLTDSCHRLKTKKGTKDCLGTVEIMQAGTSMFGCKAFRDSQKKACKCVKSKKKTAAVEDDSADSKSKKDTPSLIIPDLSHIFDDEL